MLQEYLRKLKGTQDERRSLFYELVVKLQNGMALEDYEVPFFEVLKKEFATNGNSGPDGN